MRKEVVQSFFIFRIRGRKKFGDLLKPFERSGKGLVVPFSSRDLKNTIEVETFDI